MPKKLISSPLCSTEKVTEEQLATDLAVLDLNSAVNTLNRRSFFSKLSAAGAVVASAGLVAYAPKAKAQASAGPLIVDVLNFALNLEYLEANLYLSVTGQGQVPAGLGGGAKITGLPGKLALDQLTQATFENLVLDETHHIELLRTLILDLGSTPISQPAIDYSLGGKLSITTQAQLLAVTRQFTTVGNAAYTGGSQYLVANPYVLTGAGQILGAEAQHLGAVNYLCDTQGVISPKIDSLDNPPAPPNTFFTVTPADGPVTSFPALGPIRTVAQILGIAYGVTTATSSPVPPAGVTSGGFFPQGVNGPLKST